MYRKNELTNFLFFSFKTSPNTTWENLSVDRKNIWLNKCYTYYYEKEVAQRKMTSLISSDFKKETDFNLPTHSELYEKYAGLYPEFAKIDFITVGVFDDTNVEIQTIKSDDEKTVLETFNKLLVSLPDYNLCGWNINNLYIPFLLKRMWINDFTSLPTQLQLRDAKPWTIKHVDLMLDWKNSSTDYGTLELVASSLNINTDLMNDDTEKGYEKNISVMMELSKKLLIK